MILDASSARVDPSGRPNVTTLAVWAVNGIAAARIRAEIRKQQIGSANGKLKNLMQSDEIMTAIEPNVSARM